MFDMQLSKEEDNVLLSIHPGGGYDTVSEDVIRELFSNSDYCHCYLDEDAVKQIAESVDQQDELTDTVAAIVAQQRDAVIEILISDDKLQATARITAAFGGKSVQPINVITAAREAGITVDLIMKEIATIAPTLRKADPGAQINILIAEGEAPIHGKDAYCEQLALTLKDRVLAPQRREDGTVDMRDLGDIPASKPGDELMRRHPKEPGKDGVAVTGEALPALQAKDIPLEPGEGTEIARDDENLLLATKAGIPRAIDKGMTVDDILEMDKVDLSTGNIVFDGCVLVRGDIGEDMEVTATGDVSVGGIVESATIVAGGEVIIGDGVIGHQVADSSAPVVEHSAKVEAKGDIHVKYAQNVDMKSDGSVTVEKYLFHSHVSAAETIWVGNEGVANGRLMGGRLKAGQLITSGVIGTPSGAQMDLDLSYKIEKIDQQLKALDEQLNQDIALVTKLDKALRQIDPSDPNLEPILKKTILTQEQARKEMMSRQAAISLKKEAKKQVLESVSVVANKQLFPQVLVSLLNRNVRSSREHGPVKVGYDEGEMKIEALAH